MAKDAKGHGSDARGTADAAKRVMTHVVTAYDQKQQARADSKGTYYNQYALGHYLGAVDRVHTDMLRGAAPGDAINNHMNGALARSVHKALGTGGTDIDSMRRPTFK